MSVDHVPDNVDERKRIERFNPNPRCAGAGLMLGRDQGPGDQRPPKA